jgi:hypothetical protein
MAYGCAWEAKCETDLWGARSFAGPYRRSGFGLLHRLRQCRPRGLPIGKAAGGHEPAPSRNPTAALSHDFRWRRGMRGDQLGGLGRGRAHAHQHLALADGAKDGPVDGTAPHRGGARCRSGSAARCRAGARCHGATVASNSICSRCRGEPEPRRPSSPNLSLTLERAQPIRRLRNGEPASPNRQCTCIALEMPMRGPLTTGSAWGADSTWNGA